MNLVKYFGNLSDAKHEAQIPQGGGGASEEQHKFTGPVYITLAMKRRRSNMDGDNFQKGIFDLLQKMGAIDNDKNIIGCNWYWSTDLPQGVAAEIAITQADELEAA